MDLKILVLETKELTWFRPLKIIRLPMKINIYGPIGKRDLDRLPKK